jgi:hypothetical protein
MQKINVRLKVWALLGSVIAVLAAGLLLRIEPTAAQDATITALPAIIVSRTPTEITEFTPTPSRTPTQDFTLIRVEAPVQGNVRSSPSLDAQILGVIKPGQFFAVTGRYAKWLRIQYPQSPNGVGWVYEDVVRMTGGDPASIPQIDAGAVPSPNVQTAAAQQTANYLTATPGAPETATVMQASATGVFTLAVDDTQRQPGVPLPTFTYPPPFVEATLPSRSATANRSGLPPIAPIIGLAILGVAGLFISSLRGGR